MVLARVWVEMLEFAVGIVSWIMVVHLLSKFAPRMMISVNSLLSAVLRDGTVMKGVNSFLEVFKMTGMCADSFDARSCFAFS